MNLATVRALARRLYRQEDGQDLVEYALLFGLIAVGAIVVLTALGVDILNYYNSIPDLLP